MNTHIALGPGGYKYTFNTGVLKYIKENKNHFDVKTISGSSVGTTCGVTFVCDSLDLHYLSGRTWVKNGRLFKPAYSVTSQTLFEIDQDFFELYVDILKIQQSETELYFSSFNTKSQDVVYFRIKDYLTREKVTKLMVASCTIPHITPNVLGSEENGFYIDAAMKEPYPTRVMNKYKDDVKICVLLTNPYEEKKKNDITSLITEKIVEPLIFRNAPRKTINEKLYARKFIKDNPDITFIYPSAENSQHFEATFEITEELARIRYNDGYNQAKKILSPLIKPKIIELPNDYSKLASL